MKTKQEHHQSVFSIYNEENKHVSNWVGKSPLGTVKDFIATKKPGFGNYYPVFKKRLKPGAIVIKARA